MSDPVEQLRRSWIANANAWTDAIRNDRIESRRTVTNDAIVTAALEQHARTVLDLGCGEGWLSRALASHGPRVTGIDASEPLIESARALGGAEFLVVGYEELIDGRATLPSPFDLIVANFALLDDRTQELLAALRNVLAPNGRLLIQTVHPLATIDGAYEDGWRTETFAAFPGQWPELMPWYYRTLGSWLRVLRDAGYEIVDVREPLHRDRRVPASILFTAKP